MAFGDLDSGEISLSQFQERLNALIDSVYQGQVVPLVGAGVSLPSVPTARGLLEQLEEDLDTATFGKSDGQRTLSRLCEIMLLRNGNNHADVCRKLGIADWASITPSRAHRYLAMLAADGFIQEIVTTNFDCGIEKAWKSLGRQDELFVIASALGNHHRRPRGAHLCLYKINGCADLLRQAQENTDEGELEKAARQIQLTHTQLHGVRQQRERAWVRTLLSHLVRSRSLLFSGFGSDEPQVWYVVRLILDELAELHSATSKDSEKEGLPIRLWMAIYEDSVPFHLLQVLCDERRIRARGCRLANPAQPTAQATNATPQDESKDAREPGRTTFDNIFLKRDCTCFLPQASSSPRGLEAAIFWRRVWLELLRRSLRDPHRPPAQLFASTLAGYRTTPERLSDLAYYHLWEDIVDKVFTHLPLCEPPEWKECVPEATPGSPGVTWAGTRYVTVDEEPEYWASTLLLLLSNLHDDDLDHDHDDLDYDYYANYENHAAVLILAFPTLHLGTPGSRPRDAIRMDMHKTEADLRLRLRGDINLLAELRQRIRAHGSPGYWGGDEKKLSQTVREIVKDWLDVARRQERSQRIGRRIQDVE